MNADDDSPSTTQIEDRLQRVGRYSRFVRAGLGVIVGAFLLAAVALLPANVSSVADAVDAILLPLIFVGMGLLLYGIGMHLHLMHLNLLRQLRQGSDSKSGEDEHDS